MGQMKEKTQEGQVGKSRGKGVEAGVGGKSREKKVRANRETNLLNQ